MKYIFSPKLSYAVNFLLSSGFIYFLFNVFIPYKIAWMEWQKFVLFMQLSYFYRVQKRRLEWHRDSKATLLDFLVKLNLCLTRVGAKPSK